MYIFKSLSKCNILGHKHYTVENPFECENFNHLIGEQVKINKRKYTVIAVEHFAHFPPFKEKELISLMVK